MPLHPPAALPCPPPRPRRAGIHAFYSGHDHNNDYLGELGGVRLAFGRKTGARGGGGGREGTGSGGELCVEGGSARAAAPR